MDGAYEYLRLLGEIKPLADGMNTLLNDARSKDNEIFNLWSDFCKRASRTRAAGRVAIRRVVIVARRRVDSLLAGVHTKKVGVSRFPAMPRQVFGAC